MKNRILTVAVVSLLAGPVTAQAQQYEFELLDFAGAPSTQVFGINDSGDAVGVAGLSSFVYASMDGSYTGVTPAAGYLVTNVLGINDAGVMVGLVNGADGVTRGFIRSKGGTYTVFSHPDSPSFTSARGVNNKGLVSGIRTRLDGTLVGFIYDPKSALFTDVVPSAYRVVAHGINSKGEAVGDARFEVNPCGGPNGDQSHGWLRARDGSVIYFQVNGQTTSPRGINDAGMIVGQTQDPVTGQNKGFVVKVPETNCESITVEASALLDFPGYYNTFPEGITNSGDIVGIVWDGNSNHGFIARQQ